MTATRHPRIQVARQPALDAARVAQALGVLCRAVARADDVATLSALSRAVPEFDPM